MGPSEKSGAAPQGGARRNAGLFDLEADCRRLALLTAFEVVAQLLAFAQIADAGSFDGGNVDEHVLRTIVGLDKAVALLRVEPLYGSGSMGR